MLCKDTARQVVLLTHNGTSTPILHPIKEVTAIEMPQEVNGKALASQLRTKHPTVLAGAGKSLRENLSAKTQGLVSQYEMDQALDALQQVLKEFTADVAGTN